MALTDQQILELRKKYNITVDPATDPLLHGGSTAAPQANDVEADIERLHRLAADHDKQAAAEAERLRPKTITEKLGGAANKFLGGLAKYSGVGAATDLLLTAGKGASYGLDRLFGSSQAQATKNVDSVAKTGVEQAYDKGYEKGGKKKATTAAVKNIAGKSLETFAAAAPFAGGAAVIPGIAEKFLPKAVAKYGALAAEGAGYGGAFGAAEGLQRDETPGEITKRAAIGAAAGGALTAGLPIAARLGGSTLKKITSLYSNVPEKTIQHMFDNPDMVAEAMRRYAGNDEEKNILLKKAEESFSALKEARNTDFRESLQQISDDTRITKTGPNAGTMYVKNKEGVLIPTKMTLKGVKDNITTTLKDFNIDKVKDGWNFDRSPIKRSQQNDILELIDRVYNWEDNTPRGFHDLKQIVASYRQPEAQGRFNAIIQSVKENLSKYINERAPAVGEMDARYSEASDFIDNIKNEIFGNKGVSSSVKLMRLSSIFNKNSEFRQQIVDRLGKETGERFLDEVAGAALSSWLPTGWVQRFLLGGVGVGSVAAKASAILPTLAGAAAAASPRVIGETTAVAGRAAQALRRTSPVLKDVTKSVLQNVIQKKMPKKREDLQ